MATHAWLFRSELSRRAATELLVDPFAPSSPILDSGLRVQHLSDVAKLQAWLDSNGKKPREQAKKVTLWQLLGRAQTGAWLYNRERVKPECLFSLFALFHFAN